MDAKDVSLSRQVGGGGGGGTEITDGIVVKARDANGYATEVDFYGEEIMPYGLGMSRTDGNLTWRYLQKINFKNPIKSIGMYGLGYFGNVNAGNQTITFSDVSTVSLSEYCCMFAYSLSSINVNIIKDSREAFKNCINLHTAIFPKCVNCSTNNVSGRGMLHNCTGLTTVQFGSIGNPVIAFSQHLMKGCTQTGLTVTLYTTDAYADTALTNIRNGATNATIIIKDSTTDETLVTSTP